MKQWKDRPENEGMDWDDIDFTQLRYVLYARKSTTDESHQEHSIPDQLAYCREFAKRNNLNVVAEITEKQSAKTAGKRPKFRKMLDDIKAGKYDGILAWHPDRLCRNMLEAGEIIDMLDNWDIVDLKFCQHQFANNASGKMMLGMMFVFSKQYSDALKERVQRGIDTNVERGISNGARKWGYVRNSRTKQYEPDENWDIIKHGWMMRIDGASCREIHKYFKNEGLHRVTKTGKVETMESETTVRNIFTETLYYGVLNQAKNEMHLMEHYDFKPMITEEQYNQVQLIRYKEAKKRNILCARPRQIFLPLRGMVICDVCKHPMTPGRHMPRDKSGRILYYECRNKHCTRKQKGVMAGEIFDQIYAILDRMQFDEPAYKEYVKRLSSITDEKLEEIRHEIKSRRAVISGLNKEIEFEGDKLAKATSDALIKRCNTKIQELELEINGLEAECDELQDKIKDPEALKLSQQEFVNLMKTLGNKMRSADIIQKDKIARKLFVNLYLDDQKRLTYLCKEPFDSIVTMSEKLPGGDMWT